LLSRRLHKWLALLVGVQLVIWAVSGFYMVAVHIDIIHGDMLVQPVEAPLAGGLDQVLSPADILSARPDAHSLNLFMRGQRPVYLVASEQGDAVLDARSGEPLPALTGDEAAAIARRYFSGDAPVRSTTLVERDPPSEIAPFPLPLWRVDFDDRWGTSFYIAPDSGRFVTRRHTLWRVFDFLWMLHIMDYEAREDINNSLLRILSSLALLLGLTGSWLVYLRFAAGRSR
jgi:hypothetical protein